MKHTTKPLADQTSQQKIIKIDFSQYDDTIEMASSPKMYCAASLPLIDWPNTPEAIFARSYFSQIVEKGTSHFFSNINADLRLLKIDDHLIPVLITDNTYTNSYVCSPHAHYVSLALTCIKTMKNPFIRKTAELAIKGFGKILKFGEINRIIYVNHWLLSTDLYSKELTATQIAAIDKFLKEQFPTHTIAFRSINDTSTSQMKSNLKNLGFKFVATRQIYLTTTSEKSLFSTRIIKSDLRLWRDKDYEVVEHHQIKPKDYPRILELYNIVSLEHHSELNPQINLNFISLMVEQGLLKIKALKKNDVIYGVSGYFIRDGLFLCPFFGYDKYNPDKNRLYRLLSTMLLLEASKEGHLFHQSAGASFYKTIRRATNHQEYIAVSTSHLKKRQRLSWKLLGGVMNTFGISFMKRY